MSRYYVDTHGVGRVPTLEDMPEPALRCAATGRHPGFGDDPSLREVSGWGPGVQAVEVTYRCDCTRTRREIRDRRTGERLSRSADYGGGTLLASGGSGDRTEAMAVWLGRVQERADRAAAEAAGRAAGNVTPLFAAPNGTA